jgi:hypothetical protein
MKFIIESEGEIKEAFSYERPLNDSSRHALLEYARANYGPAATLRMRVEEETDYTNGLFIGDEPRR